MKAGVPSSVCTRFGIKASCSSTVSAPTACSCSAVTGLRSRSRPMIILARRDLQVGEVLRQAEHRHDLGGDGDVELGLARVAVGDAAEADDDIAQRAVVHVDGAGPGDAARVDVQFVAVVDVVVDQRGEQVVGRGDGVEVAGEVQVDLLHRDDLREATAGRAALDAEARARARARASRRPTSCRSGAARRTRPTVVVVLPSPAAVGLMAVTRISLPFLPLLAACSTNLVSILAIVLP